MSQDNRIKLTCTVCNRERRNTSKNVRKLKNRLQLKKYCKFCKTNTVHKETK